MRRSPQLELKRFYDQALLTPELLCLHCGCTAWNRADCLCSPEKRQDCTVFVADMVNRLARPAPPLEPVQVGLTPSAP